MENVIKEISNGVYGLAFWAEDKNTYFNCYLLRGQEGYILIDTTIAQPEVLIDTLRSIGVEPGDIHSVILTHGHVDHISNIDLFPNADKYIHINDLKLISMEKDKGLFKVLDGDSGKAADLEWVLAGGHTEGSIILYHKPSKALFIGDIICFFGVPLPQEGLISEAQDLREQWYELVSSGALEEALKQENKDIDDYKAYIKRAAVYDADYLCSGHGVVLKQDIQKFLNNIVEA